MKNLFKVLLLLPCLIFLVNCSKSSNKKASSNQCYSQSQYGQTYYNPNCQNSGNNGGYNGGYGQQCVGWYYSPQYMCGDHYCPIYCDGANCSRSTLTSYSTGQSVTCQ